MGARLSMAIGLLAALASLAIACGGGGKSPAKTPTGLAATRSVSGPTATPRYESLVEPIADSDNLWDKVTARVSGNLSPVLRPPSPPEGFDTMQGFSTDNYFAVDYSGPNKRLRMHVGYLSNPELPTDAGHQETVMMRGIECTEGSKKKTCPYLQVRNDANPKEFSFLLWYEPGHEVFPGAPDRGEVEYYLLGEGVEPDVLINFAISLTESGRAETPQPVTRITLGGNTPTP